MSLLVKVKNKIQQVIKRTTSQYARVVIDISKYQCAYDGSRMFDFDVYETSDGIGVIVKASQGVWEDIRYMFYITELLARSIFFGTYHFADMRCTAKASAQFWANQINSLPEDEYRKATEITRHWLDVENYGFSGYTKVQGRTWIREFLDEMDRLCPGVRIGIYTSYYGWSDNVAWMPEIAERDLWIAHYGNPPAPSIPLEWYYAGETWILWQTCDNCTVCGGCGKTYGAASASIDTNDFNGTMEDYSAWITTDGEGDMSSQEYLELKQRCDELDATLAVLREDFENHSHEGGSPPGDKYTEEYIVMANPNLRLRETPETGDVVIGMPYSANILVDPSTAIPDSKGRGVWVPAKYGVYAGWTAKWLLKKK